MKIWYVLLFDVRIVEFVMIEYFLCKRMEYFFLSWILESLQIYQKRLAVVLPTNLKLDMKILVSWWHPRWIPRTKASDAELWCFLDLRLNKRLSRQSWGWWFETLSRPLWRHRNELTRIFNIIYQQVIFSTLSVSMSNSQSIFSGKLHLCRGRGDVWDICQFGTVSSANVTDFETISCANVTRNAEIHNCAFKLTLWGVQTTIQLHTSVVYA